jgi:hypothetical protein
LKKPTVYCNNWLFLLGFSAAIYCSILLGLPVAIAMCGPVMDDRTRVEIRVEKYLGSDSS